VSATPGVRVLDASALLAFLFREPGGEAVPGLLPSAVVSSVNWSETVQKAVARRVDTAELRDDLEQLGMLVEPFTVADAERAAELWSAPGGAQLSLGDRACLALASRLSAPAVTADRRWREAAVGVPLEFLRG
jgi:ribonuclease VapC